jgi:hypothetical protein
MHHAPQRRACALLLLVTVIAGLLITATFFHRSTVHAAFSNGRGQIRYYAKPGTITRISTSINWRATSVSRKKGPRVIPFYPKYRHPAVVSANTLPHAGNSGLAKKTIAQGALLHNFDGLNDVNQARINGGIGYGETTPPDQGLCIGNDPGVPGTEVVFALINSAIRETAPNGGKLAGHPLLQNKDVSFASFWEPYAFSDPRCFYDQSTQTFFFTVVGFNASNDSTVDIAVYNTSGFKVYQVDTSDNGIEFGDQPHVGYDQNALYVSTDEFNNTTGNFDGAMLFAVSKIALVTGSLSPNPPQTFGPLSLSGIPVLTLQPAINTTTPNIEYLLNSFPYDASGNPNPTSNQLGLWQVTGDSNLTTAVLSGSVISSQSYAFPVPAVSTGNGKTKDGITSENALNPGDSRMQQVQFSNGSLWAALTTAVSVGFDPTTRDGIAWFQIDPVSGSIVQQGYIASQGYYLIYPAILHTTNGTDAITFTLTNATTNPSAAYVGRGSTSSIFGAITIAARGRAAHHSFSDSIAGGGPRWGDYSAAVLDTNNSDIWLATEYISTTQDPYDNWGTRIFAIKGA